MILAFCWVCPLKLAADDGPYDGVLIHLDSRNELQVNVVPFPPPASALRQAGLLLWTAEGRDNWVGLPSEPPAAAGAVSRRSLAWMQSSSRGGENLASDAGSLVATAQLDQLLSRFVVRGNGLITPTPQGVNLNPKLTIRRRPEGQVPFPADELILVREGQELLRISFLEGQEEQAWSEIHPLPDSLCCGLSPGEYTLRAASGGPVTAFRMEEANVRDWVLRPMAELESLLATRHDPLYLQLAVERLLDQRDDDGKPQPYLADALDLLDAAQPADLTQHLQGLRDQVRARLSGQPAAATKDRDGVGIAVIDRARAALALGQWNEAAALLKSPGANDSPRARLLAKLYLAVLLAESGQATGERANVLFLEAVDALPQGDAGDVVRVRNSFANFLVGRAQDRVHNHAFQVAAGVESPLSTALRDWLAAREQYLAALSAAQRLGAEDVAAVRTNLAKSYALLADILHVLNSTLNGPQRFTAGEFAAQQLAWSHARDALSGTDDRAAQSFLTQAVGHEILAHLAFRSGAWETCQDEARQARRQFLEAGSLAGVEGIHRLLGLMARQLDTADTGKPLNHFLISHLLTETLRERLPTDQLGLSLAGFLARRAYVNEQIVELSIAAGQHAAALRFAELAKARALRDVLEVRGLTQPKSADATDQVEKLLSAWPTDVAALEYFLGTRRAWVFLIKSGEVTAHPMLDADGQPLESRDLIARVQRLNNGLDKLGPAEGRRIANAAAIGANLQFEQSWQDELHWFYNTLVPSDCRRSLSAARTVVIVPHHILHYFPFAALVTEPDRTATDSSRMPLPKFFVEEPFHLVSAPSLTTWRLLRERDNRSLEQVRMMGIADFGGRASRLDGVQAEVANFLAIFGDHVCELVSDQDATETKVRSLLTRPGILSVSTHGQKIPDRPLEGYLVCQADEKHDGYLRAEEIYGLDVQSDLVLLNACYGGFADRSPLPGDDLFGVQRALLHSGARTVVSGLWDIYDNTAPDIMKDFWTRVASGTSAPQALAGAQRDYLKTWRECPQEPLRFLTHPYYWSVFTVAGDDRTGSVALSVLARPNLTPENPVAAKTQDKARSETAAPERTAEHPIPPSSDRVIPVTATVPASDEDNTPSNAPADVHSPAPSVGRSMPWMRDVAFERLVDFQLMRTALTTWDAGLLVDVSLQLAAAERTLGRTLPAVNADRLLGLAARMAGADADKASLDRLTRYAQAYRNPQLSQEIESARKLAGRSRDVSDTPRVSVEETSPQAYAEYTSLVREVRLASLVGDFDMLSDIDTQLQQTRDASPAMVKDVRKLIREARETLATVGEREEHFSSDLARLMSDGRCDTCRRVLSQYPQAALQILVDGSPLPTVHHNGRTYLPIPKFGVEYEIRVGNLGPCRMLAVVSVDGLSVMNGQPVTEQSSGYVVAVHGSCTINGWRRGQDKAAAFTFQPREQSYAALTGKSDGIGVIRLVAIAEQPAVPIVRHDMWGIGAPNSSVRTPVLNFRSAGTGYGREVDSRVTYVNFRRSGQRREITLHYDTREALMKSGVVFPDFAPPPPGLRVGTAITDVDSTR